MSSYIVRLIRETGDGNIVNDNGKSGTLRQYPFSLDTCSLSALDNENGCYEVSLTSSDLYKLFINGIEEKSFGGSNGYWIATENNNGWYFDRINSIRLSTSSNNVVIGTNLADSHKLAIFGDASITGNLYVTGSINSPTLSSLTAGITLNQYTLSSNFVSTTANLLSQLNSLSSNVGNLNRFTLTSTFGSITASLTGGTLLSKTSSQIFLTNSSDSLRLGNSTGVSAMKLEVQGQALIGNTTYYGASADKGRITWGGVPQNFSFYALSTLDVAIGTNAGILITATSGGNVGINNTSPTATLHLKSSLDYPMIIEGSNSLYAGFQQKATITNAKPYVELYNSSNNKYWGIMSDPNLDTFFVYNTGAVTPRLTISNQGNVGVGTTTPQNKLSVSGNTSITGALSTTGGRAGLTGGVDVRGDGTNSVLALFSGAGSQLFSQRNNGIIDVGAGTLDFTSSYIFNSSNIQRLVVHSNGNVGVGNAIPNEKLSVTGNISVSGGIISASVQNNSLTGNIIQSGQTVTYNKGANHIIAYNDAGTIKYRYFVLTGTDANWNYSTVAP